MYETTARKGKNKVEDIGREMKKAAYGRYETTARGKEDQGYQQRDWKQR